MFGAFSRRHHCTLQSFRVPVQHADSAQAGAVHAAWIER